MNTERNKGSQLMSRPKQNKVELQFIKTHVNIFLNLFEGKELPSFTQKVSTSLKQIPRALNAIGVKSCFIQIIKNNL